MANFNFHINLSKFIGAQIMTTKTGVEVIVIPINDNHLSKGKNDALYANFNAVERKTTSSFGETHFIKQRFSRDEYNSLSQEQRDNLPFFGGMSLQRSSESARGKSDENGSSSDDGYDIF